jgi:hypothetical protein
VNQLVRTLYGIVQLTKEGFGRADGFTLESGLDW